jgi:hypothetical protein
VFQTLLLRSPNILPYPPYSLWVVIILDDDGTSRRSLGVDVARPLGLFGDGVRRRSFDATGVAIEEDIEDRRLPRYFVGGTIPRFGRLDEMRALLGQNGAAPR